MLFFLVFLFSVFGFAKAICPEGTVASFTDNTICYLFQSKPSYFLTAEKSCSQQGGHLVAINEMMDNVYLAEQALVSFKDSETSDFWIGLTILMPPNSWKWIDGSLLNFTNWNKGQPQNTSEANCGAIIMQGGKWIADDCFKIKPYVCEINAIIPTSPTTKPPKPQSCENSWTFYSGHCYKVYHSKNWGDANAHCNAENSHLASFHSAQEAQFIGTLVSGKGCDWLYQTYVGLFTDDNEVTWKWTDSTPVDYLKWLGEEPNNPTTQHCGRLFTSPDCDWAIGLLDDATCSDVTANFVCKKSSV